MSDMFEKLTAPFDPKEVKWRVNRAVEYNNMVYVIVQPYIDNRAIMNRLDEVCTPFGWKNQFSEWRTKGIKCGLSIKIGDEWITKYDGADETDFESTKGGFSVAMRRAAVQWGIGRYLYSANEEWVPLKKSKQKGDGDVFAKVKVGPEKKEVSGYWTPPVLNAAQQTSETRSKEPKQKVSQDDIQSIKKIEKYLGLTDRQRLMIFNKATDKEITEISGLYEDEQSLAKYLDFLLPAYQIKNLIEKSGVKKDEMFAFLSHHLKRKVNGYISLIGRTGEKEVSMIRDRIIEEKQEQAS